MSLRLQTLPTHWGREVVTLFLRIVRSLSGGCRYALISYLEQVWFAAYVSMALWPGNARVPQIRRLQRDCISAIFEVSATT